MEGIQGLYSKFGLPAFAEWLNRTCTKCICRWLANLENWQSDSTGVTRQTSQGTTSPSPLFNHCDLKSILAVGRNHQILGRKSQDRLTPPLYARGNFLCAREKVLRIMASFTLSAICRDLWPVAA